MRLSHVCVDALLRICAAAISDDRPCRDTWPADLHIFWVVSKLSKPPACCRYGLGCCERSPGVGALCASRDQLTVCVDLHSLLDVGAVRRDGRYVNPAIRLIRIVRNELERQWLMLEPNLHSG
jgi:hypothetical protein